MIVITTPTPASNLKMMTAKERGSRQRGAADTGVHNPHQLSPMVRRSAQATPAFSGCGCLKEVTRCREQ
jgi:hypothetical protein